MADTLSAILDFLHKHKFSVAEDALRSELSARQNGIGSLPLALDEEFDLSVHSFLQAMQDRDAGEQQAPYRSEPDISVAPTERSKAAQSGFNFIHGRLEAHDGETFHESAFAVPEKAVFVDTGLDIDESLKSSRMTKTSLGRHGTAMETDRGARKSGGDDVNVEDSAQQQTTFTLGGQRYNKVLPSSKHKQMPVKGNALQEEDAVAVQVFDEPQSRNQVLVREEQLNFQVDEDDMIRPDLWKTEDVSFEESRRVESQGSERDVVNLLDCSERIGEIELEKPNTQLPRKIGSSRKAAPKSGPTRIISDLDIWDVPQGSKEDTQYDNGQDHDEKSILVRDMIANERPSKRQILSEDTERPELHLGNGASPPVTVPKEMGTVENGVGARKNHGRGVPIKTPLPQPVAEALSNTLKTAEPLFSGGDLESLPVEDKISQVKSSEAPVVTRSRRSSRERARSADAGLKSHESGSRAVHDAQAELPRLPHVKVRSGDPKMIDCSKDGLAGSTFKPSPESGALMASGVCTDGPYGLGSFLDVPVGQDVSTTGMRRSSGASRPSVSQGIVEDASERLSGIATAGDGQSESVVEYPDEYWDSDTYDDDEDPGYHRQAIDDEEWFLAHEIDYPDERSSGGLESSRGHHEKDFGKYEDDDRSVLEEESYYSGEEHYRSKRDEHRELPSEIERLGASDVYGLVEESQNRALRRQTGSQLRETTEYDGQLLDVEELSMIRGEPDWQGFPSQASHEVAGGDKTVLERARDEVGSVRSGGVGISSEVAEFGSEVRGSVVGGSIIGGSSEGDLESLKDREMGGFGSLHVREAKKVSSQKELFNDMEGNREVLKDASNRNPDEEEVDRDMMLRIYSESWSHRGENVERQVPDRVFQQRKGGSKGSNGNVDTRCEGEQDMGGGFGFGGFSFPSPSSAGDVVVMSRADSGKSLWSVRDIVTPGPGDTGDNCANGIVGPDDTLPEWKRKSNESSPIISPRNETLRNLTLSTDSTISAQSTDGCGSAEMKDGDDEIGISDITKDEADAVAADDEEAAAVQEQISRIRAEEEEFETFNLKIVHRKNRTGFEEEKEFPVVLNSVIAGRYHVTEYLGSAAFSKAIQAHDLHTGMDVCMKIIKNNKDFFDQSLDEIKLLKYINKHDPGDKYHVLRLYDYFYHREHLFIVCELLRANLYEFHKYNRESGGEVYFTMPRLQSITRQCLEALEFIHGLKLIHCDLKPENILVKSYSRCEVKVIDLGSSCFQTDHLCSYVQSRSYRAPEVILGLPYNQKIDMWSLGCILAELCSGNVLFQNESLATLLARVVGILGPIDSEMLARGRDSHKFFTKNHMLYERNQESERLEYLVPKKTSLTHRLPMGDQGFVDFVGYLLQINPASRPTATEALKHPWLSYPYEPISA